jgi:hypothetical protein
MLLTMARCRPIAAAADGVELSAAGFKEGVAEFNDINITAANGVAVCFALMQTGIYVGLEGISVVTLLFGIALAFVLFRKQEQ